MFVSIIICTYRRAEVLGDLLACLAAQDYTNTEVLIVDGSGDDLTVVQKVEEFLQQHANQINLRLIRSAKGLTRQRNVGLAEAHGDLIWFFDDDVTFAPDFVAKAVALFQQDATQDVGGITGYDVKGYGGSLPLRFKLRRAFGFYPKLQPGALGRLGLVLPLGIQPAFSGCLEVDWLAGFCMLYRRAAVAGLRFDEDLPTYGAEDVNFSTRVGEQWRLLLCGDLQLRHHKTQTARVARAAEMYQCAYGIARNHLSRSGKKSFLLYYALVELLLDALALLSAPSKLQLQLLLNRQRGLLNGARSLKLSEAFTKISVNDAL